MGPVEGTADRASGGFGVPDTVNCLMPFRNTLRERVDHRVVGRVPWASNGADPDVEGSDSRANDLMDLDRDLDAGGRHPVCARGAARVRLAG